MPIRRATDSDIPAIFEVRTSVRDNHMSTEALERYGITPESIAHMLHSAARAWVAEVDGRIVAFSMADGASASIFAMFVLPSHEGRGLGRQLMSAAESWLFAEGSDEIWLRTDRNPDVRANGFYQHLGWTSIGVQEDGQVQYVKRS
jgi:GNAT superfamily N-acetyltransferase